MKVKWNKQHLAELQRINASIPKKMSDRLIIRRNQLPTVNKVVSLAMKQDFVSDKQKERLQHIKDAGLLNKYSDEINKTAQKEIDRYLDEEIAKSIAAGRLPKPEGNTLFDKYIKKCRRKAKRS